MAISSRYGRSPVITIAIYNHFPCLAPTSAAVCYCISTFSTLRRRIVPRKRATVGRPQLVKIMPLVTEENPCLLSSRLWLRVKPTQISQLHISTKLSFIVFPRQYIFQSKFRKAGSPTPTLMVHLSLHDIVSLLIIFLDFASFNTYSNVGNRLSIGYRMFPVLREFMTPE